MHQILAFLWHELNWCYSLRSEEKQWRETAYLLVTLAVELHYNATFLQMYPFSPQELPALPFLYKYKKTEITSPEKVSTIPSEFKHIFADCFTFLSVCHDYILVIQLSLFPVIFTSCMLSNTSHRLILLFGNKK